ncbi:hypothetical protein ACFL59_07890, partial [Planctomycetota bacterium]
MSDDLKNRLATLPRWAIVAFAARCAERALPLCVLPEGTPDGEDHRLAVGRAIRAANAAARHESGPVDTAIATAALNAASAAVAIAHDTGIGPADPAIAPAISAAMSAYCAANAATCVGTVIANP